MRNKLVLVLTVCSASSAFAGFLRFVPEIKIISADGKPGSVLVAGTVENQGDEAAVDVSIETVKGSKILASLEGFEPGEKKDVSVEVREQDLEINGSGQFMVPLRVNYRDTNRAPFSAPFVASYSRRSDGGALLRSSPISIVLDDKVQKAGAVSVSKEEEFSVTLTNTATTAIKLALDYVTTKEVEMVSEKEIELPPQGEKTLTIKTKNKSALPGSSYASFILVSGLMEGQHFADYQTFQISIGAIPSFPVMTWVLAFLLIVFVVMGALYARREKQEESGEKQK